MAGLTKDISAPTLDQLTSLVASKSRDGWRPVGEPVKSGDGYVQQMQPTCCLC